MVGITAPELSPFSSHEPLIESISSPTRRIRLLRPTRIQFIKGCFGGSILLAAVYGLASQRGYVASNNAVVSANVVSVRVPMDGYVSNLSVGVGSRVKKRDLIGHVENPRIDDQVLIDLRQSIKRNLVETQANAGLRNRLLHERSSLVDRNGSFIEASTSRLTQVESQQQQSVDAKLALRDELQLKLDRQRSLYREGIVSRANMDQTEREYSVADHDHRAERSALDAAHIQSASAARGILLDSGTNGGSYAQQRIDEIDMRLAEVNRLISENENGAKLLQQTLQEENSNFGMKRDAELQAPVDGLVWKLNANDGEEVEKGDKVAQFVECASAFVVAAIPQNRVPDIEIGGLARFRLSGETQDRFGRVRSVTGERNERTDAALAATPVHERNPTATVFVSQLNDSGSGGCMVGRTVRVLLPVAKQSILSELRQYAQ